MHIHAHTYAYMQVALEGKPSSLPFHLSSARVRTQVLRNRFVPPELRQTEEKVEVRARARKKRTKWTLDGSIWAPRKLWGNSRDFFETPDAMRKMFMADWHVASRSHELAWHIHVHVHLHVHVHIHIHIRIHRHVASRSHELAWHIVKCHHDPTTWRDLDRNGTHDEVDEVRLHMHTHVHTHMHTHMHTHIHTRRGRQGEAAYAYTYAHTHAHTTRSTR